MRPSSDGPKILIADDEEAICFALSRHARALGLSALVAPDGLSAAELFEANDDIAAALLDWQMPRLDGLALAEQVRARSPELPLSIMTAFDARLPTDVAGRFRILAKPFDLEAFDDLLADWGLVACRRSVAG